MPAPLCTPWTLQDAAPSAAGVGADADANAGNAGTGNADAGNAGTGGGAAQLLTELQEELQAAQVRHAAARLAAGRMQEELAAIDARLTILGNSTQGGDTQGEEMRGQEKQEHETQGEEAAALSKRRVVLLEQHTAAEARVKETEGEVQLLKMQVHDLEALETGGREETG